MKKARALFVDHNRTVKIDDARIAAIFFSDEIFPVLCIEALGILP